MTGRINDVDLITLPLRGNSRRDNGNTALALLNHPVGNCGAVIHRTNAMRHAGIEHDTLGGGGFTGVNVGNNAYISIFFQRIRTCH